MKQRRTATFSQDILVIGNSLTESNRLIFYDSLINHFLAGSSLPAGETVPGELRVAIACATPMMRKLQAQYENGISEKKFNGKTKASLCPSDGSETKQNEAKESEPCNNIYPFPKLIYILNKYISTTNQSSAGAHAYTRDDTNKKTVVAPAEEALAELRSEHPELYQYFYQIIETIENSGAMKIYGTPVPSNKIIQSIHRVVLKPNFSDVLAGAWRESSSPNVRDSIKYSISLLYNLGIKPEPKKEKKPDFAQREYSEEELADIFDTMDDIDIQGGRYD